MQPNETAIRSVVEQVLAQLGKRPAPGGPASLNPQPIPPKANGIPVVSASSNGYRPSGSGNNGVFQTVDEAVAAATEAQCHEILQQALDSLHTRFGRDSVTRGAPRNWGIRTSVATASEDGAGTADAAAVSASRGALASRSF